jgi:hypothetical protein
MARRRQVVRLGVPALIVAGLAVAALWRVGAPATEPAAATVGTSGEVRPASLEGVRVLEVTSPRRFWMTAQDERAFVVLDPDVVRAPDATIEPGARLTLVGIVRPAPAVAQAMRQWKVDEATARALQERGTYLHCTEVRAAG